MKKRNNGNLGGYSVETAEEYVNTESSFIVVSNVISEQYKYENDKRTDEIVGYKVWVVNEESEAFQIKFEINKKPSLKMFNTIVVNNLMACKVGYNVYFKAENFETIVEKGEC